MGKRLRTLLAATGAAFLLLVAVALAVEWTGAHYHLNSGQSGFTNYNVIVQISSGRGENRAVCASIRGKGEINCVGRGETASFIEPYPIIGEPFIHNHDAEAGYFKGYYLE
jgi:hypothetical protein